MNSRLRRAWSDTLIRVSCDELRQLELREMILLKKDRRSEHIESNMILDDVRLHPIFCDVSSRPRPLPLSQTPSILLSPPTSSAFPTVCVPTFLAPQFPIIQHRQPPRDIPSSFARSLPLMSSRGGGPFPRSPRVQIRAESTSEYIRIHRR